MASVSPAPLSRGTPQDSSTRKSTFSPADNPFNVRQATELLRHTRQFDRWQQLRQSNDTDVSGLADLIVERHAMADKASAGQAIDWNRFDALTEALAHQGIFLFTSAAFKKLQPALSRQETSLTEEGLAVPNPAGKMLQQSVSQRMEASQPEVRTAPSGLDEDDFVLLNFRYKNQSLNNSLPGYWNGSRLMLPLDEVARNLDFSIRTDPGTGTALGWFISEDRPFSLDTVKHEAIVAGRHMAVPGDQAVVHDMDIFVDSSLLSSWFPVEFELNFADQSLSVKPRETLPFEARIERENARKAIGSSPSDEPVFPRKLSPYSLLEPQVVDLGFSGIYTNDPDRSETLSSRYYMYSRGDLAGMSSEFYISGDDDDGTDTVRIRFEKNDPDSNLLGPLKANHIALGDIETPSMPIIGGGDEERGIVISNTPLFRSNEFDTTSFRGAAMPNWDVEIYRNDILISSQKVGSEGQYTFEGIQLYYGKNDFQVVMYGPHGEKRTETKTIHVGTRMLRQGQSEYQVSLTQKESVLYDPDGDYDSEDEHSLRFIGNYEYGLTPNFTLGVGTETEQIDGERHEFINVGAKGTLKGVYLTGNAVHDIQGGDAVQMLAQTEIGPVDLKLKQEFFNDFVDEDESSVTSVSVYGNIDSIKGLPNLPFSLTYSNGDSDYRALNVGLAGKLDRFNYNTDLTWKSDNDSEDSGVDGSFRLITQIGDYRLRGRLDYELEPELKVTGAEIINSLAINNDLSAELSFEKDAEEELSEASLRLNWKNNHITLSPEISYNSDNEFKAMLSLSTSLGVEPITGRTIADSDLKSEYGAVSARVFHDRNTNAVFDGDDEPIQGAVVKLPQAYAEQETDENGIAFIRSLPKHRPTDVYVKTDSLEDPFWQPLEKGSSIVPRPGHAQVMDIPVISTGEIDGTIFMKTADNSEKPMSNIPVQLIDNTGTVVEEVRSEYDGYYLFTKIPPGSYRVGLADTTRKALGVETAPKDMITINNEGNAASGIDFLLEKPGPSISEETLAGSEIPAAPVRQEAEDGQEAMMLPGNLPGDKTAATAGSATPSPDSTVLKTTGAGPVTEAAPVETVHAAPPLDSRNQMYGVHLTSYRDQEKAAAGITYLRNKYKDILDTADFTIRKASLAKDGGEVFRVIASIGGSLVDIEKLRDQIRMSRPYARTVPVTTAGETTHGVHLTSFRTTEKARLSIQELKARYPDLLADQSFSIQTVDLGPEKGTWKRVVAGSFTDRNKAAALEKAIKMTQPYTRIMATENTRDRTVHMASYRNLESAVKGLSQLTEQHRDILNGHDLFIRKVDLGADKGTWYRIFAGRSGETTPVKALRDALASEKQYARVVEFDF